MSGVEVAGLVCGVLPIFIETLKAYSFVSRSLHTFRHYSKAVKSVRVQFYVHQGIFFNECRLLLRLVEDEQGTKDMLDDENDSRWCSKEFNDKMNSILKDNFELCKRILEATKEIADEMKEELRKFDILVERKDNVCANRVPPFRQSLNLCSLDCRTNPSNPLYDDLGAL
jgi:hypothetical protein